MATFRNTDTKEVLEVPEEVVKLIETKFLKEYIEGYARGHTQGYILGTGIVLLGGVVIGFGISRLVNRRTRNTSKK